MPSRALLWVMAIVLLAAFASRRDSTGLTGGGASSCRSARDTAAAAAPILLRALATVDRARLGEYGFRTMPDSLSLVTVASTCDRLVAAYNAHIAAIDSTRTVSSAYIFTDGVGYIFPVYLDGAGPFHEIQTADSTFAIRRGFELQ